ncbi:unnamed protein product [Arabis nemorensis]|uniref:Pentatricopeptide repeat-containing protein n=1 Tax=Arabis nemorensis TaxID=586526 RepID=A0A565AT68_9BRAS|nr:unnamed protein product [Arabis nemorensis]
MTLFHHCGAIKTRPFLAPFLHIPPMPIVSLVGFPLSVKPETSTSPFVSSRNSLGTSHRRPMRFFLSEKLSGFSYKLMGREKTLLWGERSTSWFRKNLFQWNDVITSYSRNELYHDVLEIFIKMITEIELLPDNFTFPCVIKACAGITDVGIGLAVHGLVVKNRLIDDVYVSNTLVSFYGTHECFLLLGEMMEEVDGEFMPDVATLVTLLRVCAREREIGVGKGVHGWAVKLSLDKELIVKNALMDMYSKCGCINDAQFIFKLNNNKNVVSWNTMVGCFSAEGDIHGTFDILRQMLSGSRDVKADEVTILNAVPVCFDESVLPSLKELHYYSLKQEFIHNELVANVFLTSYAKCGSLSYAHRVFRGIRNKPANWNALIGGYSQSTDPRLSLDAHLQMKNSGLLPDMFTVCSLLSACSQLKSLQVLFDATKDKSLASWNITITGYLQNGFPERALGLFRKMVLYGIQPCEISMMGVFGFCGLKEKSAASWNAMIMGCGIHERAKEAIKLFEEMQRTGYSPDDLTFLGVLMACNHGGLIHEGLRYLDQMKHSIGLKPNLKHYACVIDISCRIHRNMEMGEKIAAKLFELEPAKPENYVLLSNLYAGLGRWDDVRNVRQRMKEMSLRNDAGCSWIELNGKVFSFVAGESCSDGL